MFLKDNSEKNISKADDSWTDDTINSLKKIANRKLSDLVAENPGLLVFSDKLNQDKDGIGNSHILDFKSIDIVSTGNLMGFIGVDDVQLTIGSRFDKDKDHQYIAQYMLQKVFSIKLFDLKTEAGNENIWEFLLIYMFPFYLGEAMQQGLYKAYKNFQYNNANVKGCIEVNRHIKINQPFMGNIAYKTREFSYDNDVIQLIRHTIEYIAHREHSKVLSHNWETQRNVQTIRQASTNYHFRDRAKVCMKNSVPIRHPFFIKYEPLRKVCLQILRNEGLSWTQSKNKVHGILFDGAWLWEEYLNTILKKYGYEHPQNNANTGGLKLFKDGGRNIYPDFYSNDKKVVIDAKYKGLAKKDTDTDSFNRNDLYQIITYMYRLKAEKGIFIYPSPKDVSNKKATLHNSSYGEGNSRIENYGMIIPQNAVNFEEFIEGIKIQEKNLETSLEENFNQKTQTII